MALSLVKSEVLCLPMWSGELNSWVNVEKSIQLYLYLISTTFECIALELMHLLAKYN